MKIKATVFLSALTLASSSLIALGQEASPAPAGAAEGGGGRRGGNPEEFRARMAERLKTAMKATDEEWAVIQPLMEKVRDAQREAGPGFGRPGGFGGPGGPGGRPPGGPEAQGENGEGGRPERRERGGGPEGRGGSPEAQALRTALEDEKTTPAELQAKLTAVREQRKKGAADLAAARENLKKVLTTRQEAVLVAMGVLE